MVDTDTDKGAGWMVFASMMLILVGVMRIFDSIWAFRHKGTPVDSLSGALFGTNLKTYGWIYLIIGILLILAGIYVLRGSQFFRWLGIIAAAIAALSAVV